MVKISRVGNWLTAVFLSSSLFCLGCGKATRTEQIQESFENANRPSYGVSAGRAPFADNWPSNCPNFGEIMWLPSQATAKSNP